MYSNNYLNLKDIKILPKQNRKVMKKVDNRIYRFTSGLLIGLLGILSFSCVEKDENLSDDVFETFELEGFLVGFDPCTVTFLVGYVIISNDFQDTVTTYSLSPPEELYRMPTPVGLDPKSPLFSIPEDQFRGGGVFPEFHNPEPLTINYPIKITYRKILEEEKRIFFCNAFIGRPFGRNWSNNQVIVLKAEKSETRISQSI